MTNGVNRIQLALAAHRRAQEGLRRKAKHLAKLLAADLAAEDPGLKAIAEELRDLRKKLHRVRMTIGRKKFALKKRRQSARQIIEGIRGCRLEEEDLAVAVKSKELAMEDLQRVALEQVQARLQGQVQPLGKGK